MLGALYHEGGEMICCFQIDGIITYANAGFCTAMGMSMSDTVGSCIFDCWPVDMDLNLIELIHQIYCDRMCIEREYSFRDEKGRLLWHKWYFGALFDKTGEIMAIFAVGQESGSGSFDVTAQIAGAIESIRDVASSRKMEEALHSSEKNFRKLAEIAPAMIFVIQDDNIIYVNNAAEIITGYSKQELSALSPLDIVHRDCQDWLASSPATPKTHRSQIKLLHKKGYIVWLDLSTSPITFSGKASILGVGIDITKSKQAEREILYLSYHDKLTGLYNRAYFEEMLVKWDHSQYMPLSFIIGDLNGLKVVNDVFGHQKGDKLLKGVAEVMRQCCHKQDIVARWGGDEFVVLLPNCNESRAAQVAQNISKACKHLKGMPVQASISLGISTRQNTGDNLEGFIKEAEDRMYRAKLLESKSYRSHFMSSLEKTLLLRSDETQVHTQRLRDMVVALGQSLHLAATDIDNLILLAKLHDIGKIAIPSNILDKPGRLTEDEWELMKKHPEIGYRIALSSPELAVIAEAILAHHERWDGSGYPLKLKAQEIPLLARILAIADAYDVMVSGRHYQKEISRDEALKEIERCAGTQFDPELALQFIKLVENDFSTEMRVPAHDEKPDMITAK